jgi:hypothetical protein
MSRTYPNVLVEPFDTMGEVEEAGILVGRRIMRAFWVLEAQYTHFR